MGAVKLPSSDVQVESAWSQDDGVSAFFAVDLTRVVPISPPVRLSFLDAFNHPVHVSELADLIFIEI